MKTANRTWLLLSGTFLLIALVLSAYLLVKVERARRELISAMNRLERLQAIANGDPIALLRDKGLAPIRTELLGLNADLRALQKEVGGDLVLLSRLGWVPSIGPTLRAIPYLLQMGLELSTAGEAACKGVQPILELVLKPGPPKSMDEMGAQLLQGLIAGQASWLRAQEASERALVARAQFVMEDLHPLVATRLAELDKYLPLLRPAMTAPLFAPGFLGSSRPRKYLILAQNSDELRATGGFISGIGLLVLEKGKIAQLSFKDSYAVDDLSKDHPDSPPGMLKHMGIDLWLTKDTNWFPHFPSSAQAAEMIYRIDQEVEIDGVIAADLTALQMLVSAVGPLTLNSGETIDGSNVLQKIQSYWAPTLPEGMSWKEWEAIPWEKRKQEWFDRRKDFMPEVVNALKERVLSDPGSLDITGLLRTIKQILDEKHALIYLHEPQVQQVLRDLNWDGAMLRPPHDYLAVVDTNVGYTKVNPNIEQRTSYQVNINRDGTARGRLTLSYKNLSMREIKKCVKDMSYDPSYELMMQRCYWDYVRVYVPAGATLLQKVSVEEMEITDEGTGHTIFATSFVIAPREEYKFSLEYQLPTLHLQDNGIWTYNLLVQKQAGTQAVPLYVDVRLPDGAKVKSTKPESAQIQGGLVRFRMDLRTDQRIHISFQP